MNRKKNSCKLKQHKHLIKNKQPVKKTCGGHSHLIAPQRKDTIKLDKQRTEMILIPQNKRPRNQKLQNTVNVVRFRIKIANNSPPVKGCSHKIMITK